MMTRTVPQTENETGHQPAGDNLVDGDLVEWSIYERATREGTSWRRAFFSATLVIAVLLLLVLVLILKSHTEAWLYVQRQDGEIIQLGTTAANNRPAPAAVKHQLSVWISDVRTIAPGDPDLNNRNASDAFYMVARDSAAFADLTAYLRAQNPLDLAKRGYARTVETVDVSQLTPLSFRIAWTERLRQQNGEATTSAWTTTVTLGRPPQVPDDPIIGGKNPAGAFIASYDAKWGVLAP